MQGECKKRGGRIFMWLPTMEATEEKGIKISGGLKRGVLTDSCPLIPTNGKHDGSTSLNIHMYMTVDYDMHAT